MSSLLTLESVRAAQQRIAGRLHRTPLVRSATLSAMMGANIYLKVEALQKTGSFKPRGAFNKLLSLSQEEQSRGVVGVSGGNHAQGLAYAAKTLGLNATICMPKSTPRNYLEATRGYGAEIVLCDDIKAAFAECARRKSAGATEVHPFDDPLIAAGQGTIGLEILEDLPQVSRIYVSIGGGGLIAGIAAAVHALSPLTAIYGVETRGADTMARTIAANDLVEMPAITSIARTLGSPRASEFTWKHVRELVKEVVVVEDSEALENLVLLLERTKYLTEPAASCCLAAARRHTSSFKPDDNIVILLCGGNVALEDVCRWRQEFGV